MSNSFPQYTTDYISGVMSLRKPQTESLKILEQILDHVPLRKGMDLEAALDTVHSLFPICSDFERDFMSLTFALATGVGKTRLMGAFIAYLYTQKDIKNFFVVAPNTTIYEKLKRDLSDVNSSKYVFRGLGCFSSPPKIITDDDYREKNLSLFDSDVHIYIYNIDKFNKEGVEMKKLNETVGGSFYQALSNLPDLVLIMDESQLALDLEPDKALDEVYQKTGIEKDASTDALLKKSKDKIRKAVTDRIQSDPSHKVDLDQAKHIVEGVQDELSKDEDLGKVFEKNRMPLTAWMLDYTEETHRAAQAKFIPIPQIKVTDAGVEEYVFTDFNLDLSDFRDAPIKNELLLQNLEDPQDRQRIKGDAIDFEGYNPKKVILDRLREKPEIDYQRCSNLLFKLITQVCDHYETQYGSNGMQNIVMMHKIDIADRIYKQMMQHFYCENGFLQEEVIGSRNYNLQQKYQSKVTVGLFDDFTEDIHSVLFTGIKRGVFESAKFDSKEGELTLARILETDPDVQNWLRPHPKEFNITYNHGHNYEPDFVVETEDRIYLVEVKGEDKLDDPDVIAKKKRGIQYCGVASRWCKANGYKEWRYVFIPSKQILPNSSFMQLVRKYQEL